MEQDFEELPKSKSQVKRDLDELKILGKQLVGLVDKQLINIPLSDKLRNAIIAARSMTRGALARQLKFIGSLMKDEDESSIRRALENSQQPHKDEVNEFHELEQWRDDLLLGDQTLLDELAEKFENFERQHVGQLVRNAKKEQKLNKPQKSARLLFKYLAELQDSQ